MSYKYNFIIYMYILAEKSEWREQKVFVVMVKSVA